MEKIIHLLMTRFNLLNYDDASKVSPDEYDRMIQDWDYRLNIFKDYCLPSVRQQVGADFIWLWYIDEQTPAHFIEQLKKLPIGHLKVKIVLTDGIKRLPEQSKKDIQLFVSKNYTHVITTRLDNDDLLHKKTMRYIYQQIKDHSDAILDLRKGFQMQTVASYYKVAKDFRSFNSFISRIEPISTAKGIFEKAHRDFKSYPNVLIDFKKARWIQFIHENNLYNSWQNGPSAHKHFEPEAFGLKIDVKKLKPYPQGFKVFLKYFYQRIGIRFKRY